MTTGNVNSPFSSPQYSTEIETAGFAFAFAPTGNTTSQRQKQMATPPRHLEAFGGNSYRQHHTCSQDTKEIDVFFAGDNAEESNEVEAPMSPTKKHVPVPWHGLPSPQTPCFAWYNPEIPTTCSRDDTIGSKTSEVPSNFTVGEIALQDVFTSANQCLAKDAKRTMSDKNGDDSKVVDNNVKHGAALARQLGERYSMRRSTRLRAKQKQNG